jgi:hypothetical protein
VIDEVSIYRRVLSGSEIQSIYLADSAGKCGSTNPPAVACAPAPSGLVGWWQAENNAGDSVNGNNGILQNGATFGLGEVGTGFIFNGTSSYVAVPDASSLRLTNELTIEFWVQRQLPFGSDYIVNKGGDWTGGLLNYGVAIAPPEYGNILHFTFAGGVRGTVAIADLEWHHCAVVARHGDSDVKFYVDGVFQPTTHFEGAGTVNLYPSTQPLLIGAQIDPPIANYFSKTLVDELSIYNRALGSNEIVSVFLAGNAGKCAPTTLPPQITQQPQSVTTNVSAIVRFSVAATGIPTPLYQWFFGNAPLANQTNAALTLSNVQPAQAGWYSVLVSNLAGAVFSSNAVLTVDLTLPAGLVDADSPGFYNDSLGTTLDGTAPQFPMPFGSGGGDPEFYPAAEPNLAAGAVILGNWLTNPAALNSFWRSVTPIPATWELNTETAIIYAVDGGNHGVSNLRADLDVDNGIYVWVNGKYKFGARQPGLPSPVGQFEYTNVFLGELAPGPNYIQILREDSGIATGYQFRLRGTVLATNQPPIITQSPASQTTVGGNTVTFNAAAIGSADLALQWQFNGNALTSQSNTSLTLANVQLAQAGDYTFVATNPYGAATSSVATLTVLAFPPVITRQPTNVTAIASTAASFSVQATGSVTLAYQWLFNSQPLAGRTSSAFTFPSVQFSNAGNYSVIVTNLYGAVTSSVATLTVNPIPPCVSVHDGLVSWWRGETNTLDAWDSNNGTALGVQYANGKVGRAFSNPFVTVPDAPSLRMTNALTIEAWVNPSSVTSVRVILSKYEYPLQQPLGTQSAYLLGLTNNGALFFTLTPNSAVRNNTTLLTTNTIPINQWSHVAATYDGTLMRLFINGSPVAQTNYTANIFPGSTALGIGGFAGGTSSPWQYAGLIDELSLYNRALSAAEIQSIFTADLTGKCLAPPVVTKQPQDQAVPLGEDLKFSVEVFGSRPLVYQWYFNGANPQNRIIGATNASLIIEKVRTNNVGLYFVAITNSVGSTGSARAQLSTLPAPSCVDMLPGLISWWPGNSNTLDAMGLNDIASYSPLGYPTGKVAAAFTFNGNNSRIQINNSASLNFTNQQNFSIELWVKATPTNAAYANMPLLEKRDAISTGWRGYSLSLNSGRLAFSLAALGINSNSIYISSGPDLRDGMFHHVAVTLDRTNSAGGVLYVDGAPVLVFDPRAHTNSLLNTTPLFIGAPAITLSNSFFNGLIDEPAIYNRALTAAEILALRTAGAAGRCKAVPTIVTQPVGGAVAQGSNFTLTVAATGIPAPRYQWRRNTAPVNSATNATLFLANLTAANAGTYSVIVSNAFGSVISTNAVVAILTNKSPLANADALNTPSNTPAVFPAAKLLLNDTDADGDPLTVTTVSTNSAQNGTIVLVSGLVTYAPPANFVGNDTFTYTIGDGRGGTAVGTVMATVGAGGAAPLNIVFGPLIEAGEFVVRFAGIPGLTYTIEAAAALDGPWLKVANLPAPVTDAGLGIGIFEFREAVTGADARYYRTVYPSY